jgi:hypothetical protein
MNANLLDEFSNQTINVVIHREESTDTVVMKAGGIEYIGTERNHRVSEEGPISKINLTPNKSRPVCASSFKKIDLPTKRNELSSRCSTRRRSPEHEEKMTKIYESIKKSPLLQNPLMNIVKEAKMAVLKQNFSRLIRPIYPNRCNRNNITYINKKNKIINRLRNTKTSMGNENHLTHKLMGHLQMQIGSFLPKWKDKYATLIDGVFRIFPSEISNSSDYIINFNILPIHVSDDGVNVMYCHH